MIEAKAGSACHSSAIAQFSKAIAPACAPYLRPAGKAEIDYFGFKLIVDVLIRVPWIMVSLIAAQAIWKSHLEHRKSVFQ